MSTQSPLPRSLWGGVFCWGGAVNPSHFPGKQGFQTFPQTLKTQCNCTWVPRDLLGPGTVLTSLASQRPRGSSVSSVLP